MITIFNRFETTSVFASHAIYNLSKISISFTKMYQKKQKMSIFGDIKMEQSTIHIIYA